DRGRAPGRRGRRAGPVARGDAGLGRAAPGDLGGRGLRRDGDVRAAHGPGTGRGHVPGRRLRRVERRGHRARGGDRLPRVRRPARARPRHRPGAGAGRRGAGVRGL
ncbi:MAG: hypothetical protein AVDCRST_MAG54-458, partial [uncultured Actinomycetospora sp.]